MRVLLSTIGTRGEVQPLVALALQLKALGHEPVVCAPPDFRDWIDGLGISVVSIGPQLRDFPATAPGPRVRPSPEHLRQLAKDSVAAQFATITEAGRGCDVVLAGGALQVGARSVAEALRIRYVYASYCPVTLPSLHHAPPPLGLLGDAPTQAATDNRALWAREAQRWNDTFGAALNAHRASAGLPPIADVRSHIFTDRPWLAADPTLAPWDDPAELDVVQTGAWLLADQRPLSPELETFLHAGEPPIYFGFGSIRVPEDLSYVLIKTARVLGRRAIVSRGWADLPLVDGGLDCLAVGEVNQQALFPACRRRRASRRRWYHHRSRASRRTPGCHAADVRPALLGTTNRSPRDRNRAPARHTDHRLAGRGSQSGSRAGRRRPCPIDGRRRA